MPLALALPVTLGARGAAQVRVASGQDAALGMEEAGLSATTGRTTVVPHPAKASKLAAAIMKDLIN
jgi:hypothetical protein